MQVHRYKIKAEREKKHPIHASFHELKEIWKDISTSPIPDDILNLLIDSSIVAASDTHVILTSALPSTSILINRRINENGSKKRLTNSCEHQTNCFSL